MTPSLLAQQIDQATSTEALDDAARMLWQLHGQNDMSDAACGEFANAIEAKRAQLQAERTNEDDAARTSPAATEPTPTEVQLETTLSQKGPQKPAVKKHKSTGGFFAIDLGAFRCAAAGGLNPTICHLVMARGTGRDNRRTQWSVNAIERYTGISRPNAKEASRDLLDLGVWKQTRGGKHPRYTAIAGNKISGGTFFLLEQATFAAIRNSGTPKLKNVIKSLVARGLARWLKPPKFEIDVSALTALLEPKLDWLPNALIDGAADETPPIELLRQTRSLPALQLLMPCTHV